MPILSYRFDGASPRALQVPNPQNAELPAMDVYMQPGEIHELPSDLPIVQRMIADGVLVLVNAPVSVPEVAQDAPVPPTLPPDPDPEEE